MSRSASLAEMIKIMDGQGHFFRPACLMYHNGNVQEIDTLLDKENMTLGGLVEVLVYFKVGGMDETVSSSSIDLTTFFVPCVAGKVAGSIQGKSTLKFGVIHNLLVERVSFLYVT